MITTASSKTFLLIPSMPTPNGRLHLGHIAGPFLRLDAATRYLRSRGHKAMLVSGTDPYESYVSFHAESEGVDARQLARKYTQQMQSDLAAFNIDYDIWLDPLLYCGRGIYERHCQQLLQRLISLDIAHYNTRAFPYGANRKQFLPRSFLAGKCPGCHCEIVGNLCEACGRQFMADAVIAPYFRPSKAELAAEPLAWQEVDVLELSLAEEDPRIENIVADVKSLNLPSRQTNIILDHMVNQKCRVELTVPGSWGVPWHGKADSSEVIFSYSAVYPFFLAIGEIFADATGSETNAFALDSNIITISSYGSDITIPWIAVPNLLSHLDVNEDGQRQYRGYDHYWSNEFLCLHGSKFSTSRRHVIWASELIEQTPVNTDMARFYLATIDPAEQQTSFQVEHLIDTINHTLIDAIYHTIDVCLRAYEPHPLQAPSSNMAELITEVFDQQDRCFDSSQFHLQKAAMLVSNWISQWHQLSFKSQSDSYWFLKSFALISYPVMPTLAEQLWLHLGATGRPNMAAFDDKTTILAGAFTTKVRHINQADISPCLPETLSHLTAHELIPPKDKHNKLTKESCNV